MNTACTLLPHAMAHWPGMVAEEFCSFAICHVAPFAMHQQELTVKNFLISSLQVLKPHGNYQILCVWFSCICSGQKASRWRLAP
jgi:hypothetical protein